MEDKYINSLKQYYERIGCIFTNEYVPCKIDCKLFKICWGDLEEKLNKLKENELKKNDKNRGRNGGHKK